MFKKKNRITKTETLTWEYRAFRITDRWRESTPKTPLCLEIEWQRPNEAGEVQTITNTTYHKTIGEALTHLYHEVGEFYEG